jgi:hypothetical protein
VLKKVVRDATARGAGDDEDGDAEVSQGVSRAVEYLADGFH